MMPKREYDVFISYSHADADEGFVRDLEPKLNEALKKKLGIEIDVFLDQKMQNGENWRSEIDSALDTVSLLIVVMSPDAMKSPWVSYEWHYNLLKTGLKPYWLYFKEIKDKRMFKHLKDFQLPLERCFSGDLNATTEDDKETKPLLDWYLDDIQKRLESLPQLKKNREILTYVHSPHEQQMQAALEIGQAKELKRTAHRYLIEAIEHQMSGAGNGHVQKSIVNSLTKIGNPAALPYLWRLYQIADDDVRKYIDAAFHSLSCSEGIR